MMSLMLMYVPMTSATKPSSITALSLTTSHTKERRLLHEYQNVLMWIMAGNVSPIMDKQSAPTSEMTRPRLVKMAPRVTAAKERGTHGF